MKELMAMLPAAFKMILEAVIDVVLTHQRARMGRP
jgi:hypothetical protein